VSKSRKANLVTDCIKCQASLSPLWHSRVGWACCARSCACVNLTPRLRDDVQDEAVDMLVTRRPRAADDKHLYIHKTDRRDKTGLRGVWRAGVIDSACSTRAPSQWRHVRRDMTSIFLTDSLSVPSAAVLERRPVQ